MKKSNLLLFLLLTASTVFTQNNRIYVNSAATGTATGVSWMDAYPELQSAISTAVAGDTVWIAEGVYYPTASNDRTISFEPKSGVRIFGGFAGSESALSQRDWLIHPVILSGDIGTPADSTDNSFNVMYLFQPDSNTVLDGLMFRDGVANSTGANNARSRLVCGGGLYIMAEGAEAYPEIHNCRFEHNTAKNYGGGAIVNGGNDGSVGPRWNNCIFEDNRALNNGGGLAKYSASLIERGIDFNECRFIRNRSDSRGGGLFYTDSDGNDLIEIQNCRFEENYAVNGGGGAFFFLGRAGKSGLDIHKSDFYGNISNGGAALCVFSNGSNFDGTIEIDSSIFNNNKSIQSSPNNPYFDIIHCDVLGTPQSNFNINNDLFEQNKVTGSGYILAITLAYVGAARGVIENTVFKNNEPQSKVIYFGSCKENIIRNTIFSGNKQNGTSLHGGISTVQYINCRFTNEISTGPLYFNVGSTDSCIFENCTMYNNAFNSRLASVSPGNLYIRNTYLKSAASTYYFDIYNGNTYGNTYLANSYLSGFDCTTQSPNVICEGNIITSGDPMFIDSVQGDYRLQPCSPLVNAGNNAFVTGNTDLDGQVRIQGGMVDIGAYETKAPSLAANPVVEPACSGVANGVVFLQAENGCGPYQLDWSSGKNNGHGGNNLFAGTYTFTVTDAAGSSFMATVIIPVGSPLTLQPQSMPVICGDTIGGTAAVQVQGGPQPFTYQWLGSTDSVLTQLAPGNYPVTVTDGLGCKASGSVTVEKTGNLSVTVEGSGISCFGAADGSFTVIPADGKPPFQWQWVDGPAGPTFEPLSPGTYVGTLTDAFGCDVIWELPLSQPDSLSFEVVITSASDSITGNGNIQLNPITGGTQPYSIIWSTGQTGPMISDLAPGQYALTLTDYNGCSKTAVYLVPFTVGTAESDLLINIYISPNPTSQALHIHCDEIPRQGRVDIYNILGQIVFQGKWLDPDLEIDVHTWPAGLYRLVAWRENRGTFNDSFIIQH